MEMVLRLLLATTMGAIIGYQRERTGKPAGLRTHILICAGAALFTVASIYGFGTAGEAARVAAGVVAGVGFLGAGAIIRGGEGIVAGLTTASYYMGGSCHRSGRRGWFISGLSRYHCHHINCIISPSSCSIRVHLECDSLAIPERGLH